MTSNVRRTSTVHQTRREYTLTLRYVITTIITTALSFMRITEIKNVGAKTLKRTVSSNHHTQHIHQGVHWNIITDETSRRNYVSKRNLSSRELASNYGIWPSISQDINNLTKSEKAYVKQCIHHVVCSQNIQSSAVRQHEESASLYDVNSPPAPHPPPKTKTKKYLAAPLLITKSSSSLYLFVLNSIHPFVCPVLSKPIFSPWVTYSSKTSISSTFVVIKCKNSQPKTVYKSNELI